MFYKHIVDNCKVQKKSSIWLDKTVKKPVDYY